VTRQACWRALVLSAAYGVTDEGHQAFVSTRMPSYADWVADVAGAAIAVLLVAWMAHARRRQGGETP